MSKSRKRPIKSTFCLAQKFWRGMFHVNQIPIIKLNAKNKVEFYIFRFINLGKGLILLPQQNFIFQWSRKRNKIENFSYLFSDLSKKHELMKVLSHESTSNAVNSIWKKCIKFMNLTLSPRFLFLSNLGSDSLFFLILSFMLLTGMCVKVGFLLKCIYKAW